MAETASKSSPKRTQAAHASPAEAAERAAALQSYAVRGVGLVESCTRASFLVNKLRGNRSLPQAAHLESKSTAEEKERAQQIANAWMETTSALSDEAIEYCEHILHFTGPGTGTAIQEWIKRETTPHGREHDPLDDELLGMVIDELLALSKVAPALLTSRYESFSDDANYCLSQLSALRLAERDTHAPMSGGGEEWHYDNPGDEVRVRRARSEIKQVCGHLAAAHERMGLVALDLGFDLSIIGEISVGNHVRAETMPELIDQAEAILRDAITKTTIRIATNEHKTPETIARREAGHMKKDQTLETTFGQYRLVKVIGEGGAGKVWEAVDQSGDTVAIKMLDIGRANSTKRKRFKNEILFCESCRHPNIIRVVDRGSHDGTPFYVMPFMAKTMRGLFRDLTDPQRKLRYFDQLMSGVEAAHLQKVVHRDLKPENVLYDATRDALVIADFGIAHFTDEDLYTAVETKDNDRLANFQYAAPEQRQRGQTVGICADIYALGLMLNEFFTGVVPHGAGYRTVQAQLPTLGWVDEIVERMIRQEPSERPESIDAVKNLFVARKQDFVARQRLSEIQNTVIPVGEEDDPLALQPIRIIDFDWANGQLTLVLSRFVNDGWIHALRNIGNYTSVWGKGPEAFRFAGDRATISANDTEIQHIVDYFKTWLPRATEIYRENRSAARREAVEQKRLQLQKEQRELEIKQKLREQIKL
ncbi:MAG TPA: serine/threonine-protein kinase [Humisphaera sp.]|jgi:serine/threonine protein kinase|nr:serine/threonine-protein kinase [Humisphaera sp.]